MQPLIVPEGCSPTFSMKALNLNAFRSHRQVNLSLTPGAKGMILIGPNGVGKTNVLEALSFFSPGRGMRRARLKDVQCDQETHIPWSVSMELETSSGPFQVGTGRVSMDGEKRQIVLNGVALKTQMELAYHLHVAWLIPQMDRLFWDGNRERRRFLDRLILGIDPLHGTRLMRYEQTLKERLQVLQTHPGARDWLNALESILVEEGSAITAARLYMVNRLNQQVNASTLTCFPKPVLALVGENEALFESGKSALQVEQIWSDTLRQNRSIDREKGTTLYGCHKSNLQVFHQTRDHHLRESAFCSTGEQKALLISLVLAAANLQARVERPFFLLLDEVVAHLDEGRRYELFEELKALNAHIWMTGTDITLFKGVDQNMDIQKLPL